MAGRLTTVASYDIAAKAQLARNVLEAAGIPAVVTDQEIVAMDWLISNAVGGIKVQVREEDADRAAAVLDEKLGAEAGLASEEIDEDELARQALAAAPEEEPEGAAESAEAPPEPGPGADWGRDEYARQALLMALLSGLVPPVVFYAFYLWLNAAFGSGPITRWGWAQVAASGLVVGVYTLLYWAVLSALGWAGLVGLAANR